MKCRIWGRKAWFHLLGAAFLLPACTCSRPSADSPELSTPSSETKPTRVPEEPKSPTSSTTLTAKPLTCGTLPCWKFSHFTHAFSAVLEQENPLILGLGEAHRPQGFTGLSTARLFADQLLPLAQSKSSALLVELLAPPPSGCAPAQAAVEKEAQEITSGQAASNQDDYVYLGHQARQAGLAASVLPASCEDLQAIQQAGEEAVLVLMETIARRSVEELRTELTRSPPERPLLLAYGGALHNDLTPRPGREAWSYGPALAELTRGRYVELDLIDRSLIQDGPSWQSFPWFASYQSTQLGEEETLLIRTAPRSYALLFPSQFPQPTQTTEPTQTAEPSPANSTESKNAPAQQK